MMGKPFRIVIADDHEIVREGLKAILAQRTGWEVCAEAADGREAVCKALETKPDVVIIDFTMPELNGVEAARKIKKELPNTELLMLTMHNSERLAHEAINAGVKGFLRKSDAKRQLIVAIDALANHQTFFTADISTMVLKGYLQPESRLAGAKTTSERLTARETEIVQLIAEGRTTKEISAKLGVSEKTIETHRTNIFRRLDLHSAVDLVRYAIRNNLIEA